MHRLHKGIGKTFNVIAAACILCSLMHLGKGQEYGTHPPKRYVGHIAEQCFFGKQLL